MKKAWIVLMLSVGMLAAIPAEKVLLVYDEVNENSAPYIELFRSEAKAAAIVMDETAAAFAMNRDLSAYDRIVVFGMVMAFASKSPVRDWLKATPPLQGKKVSLLVTANKWSLDKLNEQLAELINARKPVSFDAVSSATKNLDAASKAALVRKALTAGK
jgi:hypothetical protein